MNHPYDCVGSNNDNVLFRDNLEEYLNSGLSVYSVLFSSQKWQFLRVGYILGKSHFHGFDIIPVCEQFQALVHFH